MSGTALGLRRWAAGSSTDAAAVELLGLVGSGRLLAGSCPWVRPCVRLGWYWLDPAPLALLQTGLAGRDRRLVGLVVILLGGTPSSSQPAPVEARRPVAKVAA